jgi:hypothetical protein
MKRHNRKVIVPLACFAALLVLSLSAFAHHGAAAYDTSKTVTVTGTVTDFQFVNPHVLITMQAKDPATGKMEEWKGELTSPNRLSRAGWTKSTFQVGDQVTLSGSPSKSGVATIWIRSIMKGSEELPTSIN